MKTNEWPEEIGKLLYTMSVFAEYMTEKKLWGEFSIWVVRKKPEWLSDMLTSWFTAPAHRSEQKEAEDPESDSLSDNEKRGEKMKHEVSGLGVGVHFNKSQLRDAIIKKITDAGEIDHYDLKQSFIDDLVKDGFLRAELGFTVMDLEQDKIIEGKLKLKSLPVEDEKGTATRHYRIRSSEQDEENETEEGRK